MAIVNHESIWLQITMSKSCFVDDCFGDDATTRWQVDACDDAVDDVRVDRVGCCAHWGVEMSVVANVSVTLSARQHTLNLTHDPYLKRCEKSLSVRSD